jgi:hypothetical protein
MTPDELQDGETRLRRVGRAGRTGPIWGKWETRTIYVQRDRHGRVCIITPKGLNWAEYDPRRDRPDENGVMVVEDWYLQIQGLQPWK